MPEFVPAGTPDQFMRVYSTDEIKRINAAAWGRGLRWGMFVNFLAWTRCEVGEALALDYDWLRLDERPPYIDYPRTRHIAPQCLPLPPYIAEEVLTPNNLHILRTCQRDGKNAFHRDVEKYVFPWGYQTANTRWSYFIHGLAIDDRGLHGLRHSNVGRDSGTRTT